MSDAGGLDLKALWTASLERVNIFDYFVLTVVSAALLYLADSNFTTVFKEHLIPPHLVYSVLPKPTNVTLWVRAVNICYCWLAFVPRIGWINFPSNLSLYIGGQLIIHFILPPIVRYINFDTTDEAALGEVQYGAFLVWCYVSTALFARYGFSFLSFVWNLMWNTAFIIVFLVIISAVILAKKFISNTWKRQLIRGLRLFLKMVFAGLGAVVDSSMKMIDTINKLEARRIERRKEVATQRTQYRYIPLVKRKNDDQRRDIRLLELLRRKPLVELQCKLHTVVLTEAPPFEAISYTWGGETPTVRVNVDGQSLKVTETVNEILRYRHTFTRSRFYWIDAVCIDQSNVAERNEQVKIMREIYAQAVRVVVWLGP